MIASEILKCGAGVSSLMRLTVYTLSRYCSARWEKIAHPPSKRDESEILVRAPRGRSDPSNAG